MSNNIEQAVMDEKKTAKKVKLIRVFSILAFVLSLVGFVAIEVITVCSFAGSLLSSFISSLLNGLVTEFFGSLATIVTFFISSIITTIAQLLAFIPAFVGLAFGIVSLILNGKTKDHTGTVFGILSIPFATISSLAIIRNIISIIVAVAFVILTVIVVIAVLLFLLLLFAIFA